MNRTAPPFRADHVGSLLRPQALLDAREGYDGPEFDDIVQRDKPASLIALEDALVREAVALQEEVGLEVVTDGDFRRRSWFADFMVALGGIRVGWSTEGFTFKSESGSVRPTPRVHVDGKIVWPKGGVSTAAYRSTAALTGRTVKVTLPTPLQAHFYGGRELIDRDAYPDERDYWTDLTAAYRKELQALADAGCRYVQIDECTMIKLCDPKFVQAYEARGEDPGAVKRTYVEVLQEVLRDRPKGMAVAMHICRGNSRGHWTSEGDYMPIAEAVFRDLDFDAYFLEYDSPRAGDFRPLAHVPDDGRMVVLGLVTSKSPALEDADALAARIDEAARYMPLDRLCLSPQCGFASSKYGNPVTAADQRAKLRLVADVAARVWG